MTKVTLKQLLSFALTFIALVALATAVILFAEQYTLKDGKFIQTGMIEIKDIRGAAVYLDDEEKGTSPTALTYLEEGEYTLKLTKDSMQDWQRNIDVKAGKVVTLFPILIPTSLQAEELFALKAAYPTESPLAYLTITEEGSKLLLKKQTIEHRLFDTAVSTTTLADLKNLPDTSLSVELTGSEDPNTELLSKLSFYPSPTGKRVLIVNKDTEKYYLADEQKQSPSNITKWITMPIDALYWSSDENTAIVRSSSLLIAVNLKNGQNILLNNAGEDEYTAVAPLKNRLLFGLKDSQTDEGTLVQVDLDGGNRVELLSPENGWGEISKIVEMEDKGILVVECSNGIYQFTSQTASPQMLREEGSKIVGIDTEEQLVAVCNGDDGDDNSDDSANTGRIYHFSQVTLYPYVDVTYPAKCGEITHVNPVNGGQNLLIALTDGTLVMTTEEGANLVSLSDCVQGTSAGKPTALLGFSYYRQYLLIHFKVDSNVLYRVEIED